MDTILTLLITPVFNGGICNMSSQRINDTEQLLIPGLSIVLVTAEKIEFMIGLSKLRKKQFHN